MTYSEQLQERTTEMDVRISKYKRNRAQELLNALVQMVTIPAPNYVQSTIKMPKTNFKYNYAPLAHKKA